MYRTTFSDGLSGITESHPELNLPSDLLLTGNHPQLELSSRPGHQVALDLLREHPPQSVTYIVLGPLTNLAHMLRADGGCVRERIGRVVIMGGALDVPGNTSPSAECACLTLLTSRRTPLMLYGFSYSQFLRRPTRRRRGAYISSHAPAARPCAPPPARYHYFPFTPFCHL